MTVVSSHEHGIWWARIDHPPVNALDLDTMRGLIRVLEECTRDDEARVLVLGGAGRHFCAGVDLREQQRAWQEGSQGVADLGEELYAALLDFPKPLIGMAHGAIVGAGLSILACCDIVVAAKGATISLPEINVGLLGGISHAATVLGKSMVNYLALTGEKVPVDRWLHAGLFLDVVDPESLEATVSRLAAIVADKHLPALVLTKQCMREVKGVGQLEGYGREHQLSRRLQRSGLADALVARFLDCRESE